MSNDSNLGSVRILKKNFQKLNEILDGKRVLAHQCERWKTLNNGIHSYAPQFLLDKLRYVTNK